MYVKACFFALLVFVPASLTADEIESPLSIARELRELDLKRNALQERLRAARYRTDQAEARTYPVKSLVPGTDKSRLKSLVALLIFDHRLDASDVTPSVAESTITIKASPETHSSVAKNLAELSAAKTFLEARGFEVQPVPDFDPFSFHFNRNLRGR